MEFKNSNHPKKRSQNIIIGTQIYAEKLAIGIYWRNDWGVRDMDISALNISGKVGWDSYYNQSNELLYSGDITNAPKGAVEYLYAQNGLSDPTLITNNIFNGEETASYKIILGRGDDINYDYMLSYKMSIYLMKKYTSIYVYRYIF
ncbi:MAG: hypothetical protein KDK54_18990 [Leptospiraceae bacterium]|nr:hypothetical protein [Leptospiraceae bacterium]